MTHKLYWIGPLLIVIVVLLALIAVWRYWFGHRRERAMLSLLHGADQLEADIKRCRVRLDRAHASVRITPGVPAAGSSSADAAIDQALRNLLEHRLWIRDRAPQARQAQLDEAVAALQQARTRISEQLQALDQAQGELDSAVRDHQPPPPVS